MNLSTLSVCGAPLVARVRRRRRKLKRNDRPSHRTERLWRWRLKTGLACDRASSSVQKGV